MCYLLPDSNTIIPILLKNFSHQHAKDSTRFILTNIKRQSLHQHSIHNDGKGDCDGVRTPGFWFISPLS